MLFRATACYSAAHLSKLSCHHGVTLSEGQIIEGKCPREVTETGQKDLSPMVTALKSNLIGKFGVKSCPLR
jgi:hypothetical protein